MGIPARIACLAMVAALLPGISPAAPVSDDEISSTLIGSWVNPPDSHDETVLLPARQVFHPNGITTLYVYSTPECRTQAARFEAKWAVVDSVLITQVIASTHPALVPVGQIERISVVDLMQDRITLDLDGQMFVREKSETCYAPNSQRT